MNCIWLIEAERRRGRMNYDEGREEFNRKDYNQLSVGWSEVESVRRSINNYKEWGDEICL